MSFFRWMAPAFGRFGDRWSAETTARFADWLRPYAPPGGKLLDLGGGTGALATHMADELHCSVTVLDITPEMLAYLPERPDVIGVLGSAEKMPFDSDTFDAIVVSDAFHHFRDQDAAVREMQRVVRCGGGVLLLEYDRRGMMHLVVAVEKILGEPGAFFSPAEICAFMADRGIDGECERTNSVSYRFLGSVR